MLLLFVAAGEVEVCRQALGQPARGPDEVADPVLVFPVRQDFQLLQSLHGAPGAGVHPGLRLQVRGHIRRTDALAELPLEAGHVGARLLHVVEPGRRDGEVAQQTCAVHTDRKGVEIDTPGAFEHRLRMIERRLHRDAESPGTGG